MSEAPTSELTSEYVHYLKAREILSERLRSTPEEIAMWIVYGSRDGEEEKAGRLDAFQNPQAFFSGEVRKRGVPRFEFSQTADYLSELMGAHFRVRDLESFDPIHRYLTYPQLAERWAKRLSQQEAVALIRAKVSEGTLLSAHPVFGYTMGNSALPTDDGWPPLEQGLFLADDVEAIEGASFVSGPAEATAKSTIRAERACTTWLESLMGAGSPQKTKAKYLQEAQAQFTVSARGFDRAWVAAATKTGNEAWRRAGRRKQSGGPPRR